MNSSSFVSTWKNQLDAWIKAIQNNFLIPAALLACALIAGGGWYGYHYFATQKEEQAHTILVDCFHEYEQALHGKSKWEDVANMCQAGYEKYSSTKAGSYIYSVLVDALIAQQQLPEALEKITFMINRISAQSPVYNLYRTKEALIKLDMADQSVQQAGLAQLEQLAQDKKNLYADQASYYVGLYYRQQGQLDKAREIWNALIAINADIMQDQARSVWASLAQEKMNGLTHERA